MSDRHHRSSLLVEVMMSTRLSLMESRTGLNYRPQNKALERTRRVGVPRLRGAVVGVPPCRSTPCSTGLSGNRES